MWLTVKELSQYIKLKEKTIYSFVNKGSIPHYRINKLIRFNKDEIDHWMVTKKAIPFDKYVNKIKKSHYNVLIGRSDRLRKEAR
jgi:excisionase family DNA binding protein